MLYTFSKSQYDNETLQSFLAHLSENDAVLLWQDGVLQAVKNPQLFAKLPRCYLLEQDVIARGLTAQLSVFECLSLTEFVRLTETHAPHIAL